MIERSLSDQSGFVDNVADYIEKLSELKTLPPKRPSRTQDGFSYGFEEDKPNGKIHFGYFSARATEDDTGLQGLVDTLRQAMDQAFERSKPDLNKQVADAIRDGNLRHFLPDTSVDSISIARSPILHELDPADFATAFLYLFERNKDAVNQLGALLESRARSTRFSEEHDWFREMAEASITQAAAKHPLLAAQVRLFIARHMTPY
ncbi:hypothetical protein [uncultured Pelagimonas sp.]|uniref:hypothetical protein n=1 Tax=uncultured Pelagimonas sp. TaxID=1618102 RepID=UPI002620D7CC|nr:hypothetical protein [uncultured Pelagimonas sp.]